VSLFFSKSGSYFAVAELSISRGGDSFDRGSGFRTPGLEYNRHGELATIQPFSTMPYRGRLKGTLIPEAEQTLQFTKYQLKLK